MPNFDGTGPNGEGSKTGRGLGDCDEKNVNKNISRKNTGRRRRKGRKRNRK